MKTKQFFDTKNVQQDNINSKSKPKSFKPMRSMVALRSLKPKTAVANFSYDKEQSQQEDCTRTNSGQKV
jgi:hypothetical protein